MIHQLRLATALGLIGLCLVTTPTRAENAPTDGVVAPGILSDADLYRLATCGAPPGGDCAAPALRWKKKRLTVAIVMGNTPVDPDFEDRLTKALAHAVAEVNGVGAGITLRLTRSRSADIVIRPTELVEGTVLTESPGFSGAGIMGVGYMTVWSDAADTIFEAVILISTTITQNDLPSVMLEEVTQSLGFLYDVESPAYEGVSILSQTSNETVTLTGQDAALLHLHYPQDL